MARLRYGTVRKVRQVRQVRKVSWLGASFHPPDGVSLGWLAGWAQAQFIPLASITTNVENLPR